MHKNATTLTTSKETMYYHSRYSGCIERRQNPTKEQRWWKEKFSPPPPPSPPPQTPQISTSQRQSSQTLWFKRRISTLQFSNILWHMRIISQQDNLKKPLKPCVLVLTSLIIMEVSSRKIGWPEYKGKIIALTRFVSSFMYIVIGLVAYGFNVKKRTQWSIGMYNYSRVVSSL